MMPKKTRSTSNQTKTRHQKRKRDEDENEVLPPKGSPIHAVVHNARSKLHIAIASANVTEVKTLLEQGHKLCHTVGSNCFIINKNWEIVKLLLQHDPTGVHARTITGKTLLMQHIENPISIKHLLELGADPNACDESDWSVLLYAARKSNLECLRTLLQYNVDINAQDESTGETALLNIVKRPDGVFLQVEKVKILLEAGADPNLRENNGMTPLIASFAYYYNDIRVTNLLLEAGASAKKINGEIEIYTLRELIRLLFSDRIGPKNENMFHHFAILYGKLLQAKADHFDVDEHNRIPLHYLLSKQAVIYRNMSVAGTFLSDLLLDMYKVSCRRKNISLNHQPQIIILQHLYKFVEKNINIYWPAIGELIRPKYMNGWDIYEKGLSMSYDGFNGEFDFMSNKHAYNRHFLELSLINFVHYDTVSTFVETFGILNFSQLQKWLDKLIKAGFQLQPSNPRVISPLTVLMLACFDKVTVYEGVEEEKHQVVDEKELLKIIQLFIREGVSVTQKILPFKQNDWNVIRDQYDVPDCLWLALISGRPVCLRALLPYWSGHPLILLLLLGWKEVTAATMFELRRIVKAQFPVLMEIGGPITDPDLFKKIETLLKTSKHGVNFTTEYKAFMELHSAGLSLKMMCRTVVRGQLKSGNDLPEKLASLVPIGLKGFITMRSV